LNQTKDATYQKDDRKAPLAMEREGQRGTRSNVFKKRPSYFPVLKRARVQNRGKGTSQEKGKPNRKGTYPDASGKKHKRAHRRTLGGRSGNF